MATIIKKVTKLNLGKNYITSHQQFNDLNRMTHHTVVNFILFSKQYLHCVWHDMDLGLILFPSFHIAFL